MRLKRHYELLKAELLSAALANEIDADGEIWIVRERVPIVENYRYIQQSLQLRKN